MDGGIDAPERLLFVNDAELKAIRGIGQVSRAEIAAYRSRFVVGSDGARSRLEAAGEGTIGRREMSPVRLFDSTKFSGEGETVMPMTDRTREALRCRRIRRDLIAAGFEEIGEGGGNLWQLHRGFGIDHVITAVAIAPEGRSVFVKTSGKSCTCALK